MKVYSKYIRNDGKSFVYGCRAKESSKRFAVIQNHADAGAREHSETDSKGFGPNAGRRHFYQRGCLGPASHHRKTQKQEKIQVIFLLAAAFFLATGLNSVFAQSSVRRVPLKLGASWSFSFTIFPGSTTVFRFPLQVENIILGNNKKFVAQTLGDDVVVVKAKTSEQGLFTGLQVQLDGGDFVSLRLQTGRLQNAVDEVTFFRGKSKLDSILERERKKIIKELQAKEKKLKGDLSFEFESQMARGLWSHFTYKDLRGSRKALGVEIAPKRWVELGNWGIAVVSIRNEKKKSLSVRALGLSQFRFGGFLKMKRKNLRALSVRRHCEKEEVASQEEVLCSLVFDLERLKSRKERLTVHYKIDAKHTLEFILPKIQKRMEEGT